MHRIVIFWWLIAALIFYLLGESIEPSLFGALGAWSLSLVQRYLGETE